MMLQFIFPSGQIPHFKELVYIVRDALKLYDGGHLPSKTEMLDIFASTLGYQGYQDFIRQSRGHAATSTAPIQLTAETFLLLSSRLEAQLRDEYSEAQCCWAIAGLFDPEKARKLSSDDIALLQRYLVRSAPTPLDDQKKRLIELECLVAETRLFDNAPELGETIVEYQVTDLGKYAAARELERQKGHPLSEIALVQTGLPEDLYRLQRVSASFTMK